MMTTAVTCLCKSICGTQLTYLLICFAVIYPVTFFNWLSGPWLFKIAKSSCECVFFFIGVTWPYRCLVTFRFWHVRGYENTRPASRWVPTESTLPSLCSHTPSSFPFSSHPLPSILSFVRSLVICKSWPRESLVRFSLSSRYTRSLTLPC